MQAGRLEHKHAQNLDQFQGLLSFAQARAGQLNEALASNEKVLSEIGEGGVGMIKALQQRGDIYLQLGDKGAAEHDFRATIAAAVRMGSKALELHATTSALTHG